MSVGSAPATAHVTHEHHDRLLPHIERLPSVGDLIDRHDAAALREALDEVLAFFEQTLVPHMQAAERALYPHLERMLQNRHSMTPMRREHQAIRASIDELRGMDAKLSRGPLGIGDGVRLRRAIFQLYALLRIHLAEELMYADIVEGHATEAEEEALAAAMQHVARTAT